MEDWSGVEWMSGEEWITEEERSGVDEWMRGEKE